MALLTIACGRAAAQTSSSYSQIAPLSPMSMRFQQCGDYPVNCFSGLPDAAIPLYTMQGRGVTVPLTLSHHIHIKIRLLKYTATLIEL